MAGFLQKAQAQRNTAQFWRLMAEGEIQAAVELFERALRPLDADVDKSARAAYHFERWLARRDTADIEALEMLAETERPDSQITRAAGVARRMRREAELARALQQQRPAVLTAVPVPAGSAAAADLERLGLTILETYRPELRDQRLELAERILAGLPASPPSTGGRAVHQQLLLWARWHGGRFEELANKPADNIDAAQRELLVRSALAAWGRQAMSRGQSVVALGALRELTRRGEDINRLGRLTSDWALVGLEGGQHEAVFEWLSHDDVRAILAETMPPEQIAFLHALALLGARRLRAGRAELKRASELAPDTPLSRSAAYLGGLSLLAETQEWPGGTMERDTLRRTLRGELEALIAELSTGPEDIAWRGHLLQGLLAYVDNETVVLLPQLAQFTRAVERVDEGGPRRRLQAIAAALLARAQAADRAMVDIQRQAYSELGELQRHVLAPLGDAIPAQVRAAVFMTLWEGDPTYDPLPDLLSIPLPVAEDDPVSAQVQTCIREVRASQAARQLARLVKDGAPAEEAITSIRALAYDNASANLAALAMGVLCLQAGNWSGALEALPDPASPEAVKWSEAARTAHFRAAWQTGDLAAIKVTEGDSAVAGAVAGRRLLEALRQDDRDGAMQVLSADQSPESITRRLIAAVGWLLIHDQPDLAVALISLVERYVEPNMKEAEDRLILVWYLPLLMALAAARAGRYSVATLTCDQFLGLPIPPAIGERAERLRDVARFLLLGTSLALLHDQKDAAIQWPARRRALQEQAVALSGPNTSPRLSAYAALLSGLLAYLTPDMLIDEATVRRLQVAQQELRPTQSLPFLQTALSRLEWQRKVMSDFWRGLHEGNFQLGRDIFLREIQPAFGPRVPDAIKLAMVLVDWDANADSTTNLLRRLDALAHSAAFDPEMINKVRQYLRNGEATRQLTRLIHQREHDQIVRFVQSTPEWSKSMPVPVAIGLLHAHYKKKEFQAAQKLGGLITGSPNLASWVKDYGNLILGYLLYDEAQYEAAAKAFERIGQQKLPGEHNRDRYRSAAYFARGVQHLESNNKEQAFSSFRLSLDQDGSRTKAQHAELAPLFAYFGVQGLETRQGGRAVQAFQLLGESVRGGERSRDIVWNDLISQIGLMICATLGQGGDVPAGDAVLLLLEKVDSYGNILTPADHIRLRANLYRLAICLKLRAEVQQSRPGKRHALHDFTADQLKSLEKVRSTNGAIDPVTLILGGLLKAKLTTPPDVDGALKDWQDAARLGISSSRLAALINELVATKRQKLDARAVMVDLFDLYLQEETLVPDLLRFLKQKSELTRIYQTDRGFHLREVARDAAASASEVAIARSKELESIVQRQSSPQEKGIQELMKAIRDSCEALNHAEKRLRQDEGRLFSLLLADSDSDQETGPK